MSYDADAFLKHQVERGMSFQGLCRAYGASPSEMRQTLARAGLLQSIVLAAEQERDPDPVPPALAERMSPLQQGIYRLPRAAAARGEVAPSNKEMAEALGSSGAAVQAAMAVLLRRKLIKSRVVSARRVVTIPETGQTTAVPRSARALQEVAG